MAQGVTCMRVGVVINPKAGGHCGIGIGDRVSLVHEVFRRVWFDGPVMITKRRGPGREVARVWVKRGVDTIMVWGRDGTINELASQLVLQQTVLGIVPSGSGNGPLNFHVDGEVVTGPKVLAIKLHLDALTVRVGKSL